MAKNTWYKILLFGFITTFSTQVYCGVNFTSLGSSSQAMITIPEFQHSEDAMAFGREHKNDTEVIQEMARLKRQYDIKVEEIFDQYKKTPEHEIINRGLALALKSQLLRESLEQTDGVGASTYIGVEIVRRK